jgi:hypothetical protein
VLCNGLDHSCQQVLRQLLGHIMAFVSCSKMPFSMIVEAEAPFLFGAEVARSVISRLALTLDA